MPDCSNVEIRTLIVKYRLKHYEIAKKMGLQDSAFSRLLRFPLSPDKKDRILTAIEKLKGEIV